MKTSLSKEYYFFVSLVIISALVGIIIFIFCFFRISSIENIKILQMEARNLEDAISESFNYTNQINSHIGQQISQHGAKDLNFILNLFHEADKIKYRNADLFSWSSFDWVDSNNNQTVNSILGIRTSPQNMSARKYTELSRKYPWTLQLSFPVMGNPSNSWVIPAGTGVVDKYRNYLGIVVIGFDIMELTSKVAQKLNQKVSFVVLDNDFRLVLKSSDIDLRRDSDFFIKTLNQEFFKQKESKLNKRISIGDTDFLFYNKLSEFPYIILMGFDRNFIIGKFINDILPNIIEIVLIVLFFLLILYFFKTRIHFLLKIEQSLSKSLQLANLAKDRLLYSISHDIKNYVFGIEGLGRIVLDKNNELKTLSEEDLQNINTICEQTEELRYFVEDLLDQNQVEAGELGLGQLKPADLKALINVVLLLNQRLITAHKAIVKTDFEEHLPRLLCDPRRMKQILLNLITNAVKYNKPQGEILITAKYLPNQIYLEIADQGFGMDEDEIKKYLSGKGGEINKSEIAQLKEIDSHGIGMPIVLNLLKLHNGRIEVESKKGFGTKVKLYFNSNKQIGEGNELKKPKKNKSILVVEDNPVNLKITTKILENEGYAVICANNGLEALEIIDQSPIDLILMDGEMPIMDGYETTKTIRRGLNNKGLPFTNFKHYKTIPIIAFMASSSSKVIAKAKNVGMNNHLEKGTNKENLLEMIREFVG